MPRSAGCDTDEMTMTAKETSDRIIRFDGAGLPVVSLSIAVDADGSVHTGVNSPLAQIRQVGQGPGPHPGTRRTAVNPR